MRLFVAVEIPAAVRNNLASACAELRQVWPAARWVPTENFHLTLQFIGATSAEELESLRDALREVRLTSDLELELRCVGLGYFSGREANVVLFANVGESAAVMKLAGQIAQVAQRWKADIDSRRFVPHITLARAKSEQDFARREEVLRNYSDREFGVWRMQEFHLFESKLQARGSEYTRLQTFSFTTETQA